MKLFSCYCRRQSQRGCDVTTPRKRRCPNFRVLKPDTTTRSRLLQSKLVLLRSRRSMTEAGPARLGEMAALLRARKYVRCVVRFSDREL